MSLGHVFLIYGGTPEDRAKCKDVLVEDHSLQFPYWTETFDPANGNMALVFGTTSKDAWSLDIKDIYESVAAQNSAESGNAASIPDVHKIEAAEDAGEPECANPSSYTTTFGGCRYP